MAKKTKVGQLEMLELSEQEVKNIDTLNHLIDLEKRRFIGKMSELANRCHIDAEDLDISSYVESMMNPPGHLPIDMAEFITSICSYFEWPDIEGLLPFASRLRKAYIDLVILERGIYEEKTRKTKA